MARHSNVTTVSMLLPALAGAVADRADAVRVGDRSASWEEISAAAAAVAAEIAGAPAIAVPATASLSTIVAVVGGLLAGVPIVPVPTDAGPLEGDHIVRDSGAVPLPPVDLLRRSSATFPEPPGTATALILYTSGTTGAPKGALISRSAIAH